ncbi:hypothetical protein ACFVZD_43770 [Streptomyces sp. NPDC058287]|uniref:hypothetical protein n=1 Tax=Streptomyces sp. NPDC058287 TaxID=3346423 RepID=UPI0036EB57B3
MLSDLSALISATTRWFTCSYPSGGSALEATLCEAQARQAVTVAAWLRYPTPMDAALVAVAGPGGTDRLDWITGVDASVDMMSVGQPAWRTWVDEVVASWSASLLTDPSLAARAVAGLTDGSHTAAVPVEFRRLIAPDDRSRRAAALLRHPDLLAPIAELHRPELLHRLATGPALTA